MKPFTILLIRLLAVYLAIHPLIDILPLLFNQALDIDGESMQMLIGLSAVTLVPLLAGVTLWFSATTLAHYLHGESSEEPSLSVSEAGLVRAGSFLVGVYLFVQHMGAAIGQWVWGGVTVASGSLAVVIMSIGLIVGARFMGRLYRRLKYFE